MEEKPQVYWKKIDFILLHIVPYNEVLIFLGILNMSSVYVILFPLFFS